MIIVLCSWDAGRWWDKALSAKSSADASVTSDALAYLTVADTVVPYASSAPNSAVRIERLASIEARLLASAAAVRERMAGGASERFEPVGFSSTDVHPSIHLSSPPRAALDWLPAAMQEAEKDSVERPGFPTA